MFLSRLYFLPYVSLLSSLSKTRRFTFSSQSVGHHSRPRHVVLFHMLIVLLQNISAQ